MFIKTGIWPFVLIGVGVIFMLAHLGYIGGIEPFFKQWWPAILIIVGLYFLVERWRK